LQSDFRKTAKTRPSVFMTQKRGLTVFDNCLLREQAKAKAFEYTAIEKGIQLWINRLSPTRSRSSSNWSRGPIRGAVAAGRRHSHSATVRTRGHHSSRWSLRSRNGSYALTVNASIQRRRRFVTAHTRRCRKKPYMGTVENTQTVSLRGVRRGDAGWGARRSNLDLRSLDKGAQIASSSLPSPSLIRPDSLQ